MLGTDDVPEAGGLDQVAEIEIERESQGERVGIECEVGDRPPLGEEMGSCVFERCSFPLVDVVVDERVVHVVADGAHTAKVECPVAEQATLG